MSIKTPNATATPTWNSSCSGEVTSAPNVPARISPADVMTVPVRADAIRIPGRKSRVMLSSLTRDIRKML